MNTTENTFVKKEPKPEPKKPVVRFEFLYIASKVEWICPNCNTKNFAGQHYVPDELLLQCGYCKKYYEGKPKKYNFKEIVEKEVTNEKEPE